MLLKFSKERVLDQKILYSIPLRLRQQPHLHICRLVPDRPHRRKKLLFIGSFGYIISLSMVAYAFYAGTSPGFLLISLLLFIGMTYYEPGSGNMGYLFRKYSPIT